MKGEAPSTFLLFDDDADAIVKHAKQVIQTSRQLQNQIVRNIEAGDASFTNTIKLLAQDENLREREGRRLQFYQYVSADADIRAASGEVEMMFDDFNITSSLREDLFNLIDAVRNKNETLDPEDQYLLDRLHASYATSGLSIPLGQKRDRFVEIRQRISELKTNFHENLRQASGEVWCSKDDLKGLPHDFLAGLEHRGEADDLRFRLTCSPPHLSIVLKYATHAETRKKLFLSHNNKANDNVPILKEILVLRDEAARLLARPNHATLRLEDKMIKSPATINELLTSLRHGLREGGVADLDRLKEVKDKILKNQGQPSEGRLYLWDQNLCERVIAEEEYSVDHQLISEYFELDHTLRKMLDMFSTLFNMSFDEVKADHFHDQTTQSVSHDGYVWHKDVKLFNSWNGDGTFLGHLYLDLFPREDKFGHMANFNLRPGYTDANGDRVCPATALVCNFTKPTHSKPSLLMHNEVWTLFHELGHAIHDLVSQTKWARFHGTAVVQDFCEAPSQMLENWCWEKDVLKSLSKHYSTLSDGYTKPWRTDLESVNRTSSSPSMTLPDDMVENLMRTKHVNKGIFYLRQVHVAMFDMAVHQPASAKDANEMNITQMWNRMRRDITGLDDPESDGEGPEWGHGEVVFTHLVDDYDAGYYGYLSSQVYALDMFHTFFKQDPMNAQEGYRYRKMILEKGGAQDSMEMLKAYLGRDPKPDAFHKELGLGLSSSDERECVDMTA